MPVCTFNQLGRSLIFLPSGPLACFPFVIDLCCIIRFYSMPTYQFRAPDLIAEHLAFRLSLGKRLICVQMKCGNRRVPFRSRSKTLCAGGDGV